jgi:hypothetical protein
MYIVYGFQEHDNSEPSKLYNSAAIVGPEGLIGVYHKTGVHFKGWQKGYEPFMFETPWGPVGVSICYDTYMIPELARIYAMNGCRLILNPTATPSVGGSKHMMASALQSRVWEDALFIASANLVGPSENLDYFGNSTIIGVPENILAEPKYYAGPASSTEEELIVATVDLSASDRMREFTATFQINPFLGEPDFLPDTWANLYGTRVTPSTGKQVETANGELETLRQDYQKALQTASAAKQTTLIVSIIAGVLLSGIIVLVIVAFRKKGK